jgi:hypothetical protein
MVKGRKVDISFRGVDLLMFSKCFNDCIVTGFRGIKVLKEALIFKICLLKGAYFPFKKGRISPQNYPKFFRQIETKITFIAV